MNAPLFSIVTVVRNDEQGLLKTRESIFNQRSHDWEWIVIDGLSSDNTLASVADLAGDRRVRIISESDKGLYDAMNKGVALARGEYINFLNAGDCYYDCDALSGCAPTLSLRSVGVLFTSKIAMYGNGECVRIRVRSAPNTILYGLPTSHQACFIRVDLQRLFPYRLDYKVSSDYNCIARIANSGAVLEYLDHATIISDQGRNSTSFRSPRVVISECARTQREVFALSDWRIALFALRRLQPMLFRRLAAFIPGLSIIPRLLGRVSLDKKW